MRAVFMGSPEFAVPVLDALAQSSEVSLAAVVTQPDRPAGRGKGLAEPPVKQRARDLGLPVYQPESLRDSDSQELLRALDADLFVVAAFGQILPQAVLDMPRRGSLNLHTSLLPRWRGASPIPAAILAGDQDTGVSLMEIVLRMDAGPVVAKRSTAIDPEDTALTLSTRLSHLGADLLTESLPAWLEGRLTARPQDEALVTYCRQIGKDEGRLNLREPAVQLWRRVRAYTPWPGAYVDYLEEPLRLLSAWPLPGDLPPGLVQVVPREQLSLIPDGDETGALAVGTQEGVLAVRKLQRAGRRPMTARDFLNGERGLVGSRLSLPELAPA
jgi:methionyl-tRNA formyltransferase